MAKTSSVEKNNRRRRLVKQYAGKRAKLKAIIQNKEITMEERFAAQLRGGPKDMVVKFDDIGCFTFWIRDNLKAHPWLADPATRMWVADVTSKGKEVTWLDPRKAQFITRTSPMGYNFGAVAYPQMGSLDFESMRQHVLAKGK